MGLSVAFWPLPPSSEQLFTVCLVGTWGMRGGPRFLDSLSGENWARTLSVGTKVLVGQRAWQEEVSGHWREGDTGPNDSRVLVSLAPQRQTGACSLAPVPGKGWPREWRALGGSEVPAVSAKRWCREGQCVVMMWGLHLGQESPWNKTSEQRYKDGTLWSNKRT